VLEERGGIGLQWVAGLRIGHPVVVTAVHVRLGAGLVDVPQWAVAALEGAVDMFQGVEYVPSASTMWSRSITRTPICSAAIFPTGLRSSPAGRPVPARGTSEWCPMRCNGLGTSPFSRLPQSRAARAAGTYRSFA